MNNKILLVISFVFLVVTFSSFNVYESKYNESRNEALRSTKSYAPELCFYFKDGLKTVNINKTDQYSYYLFYEECEVFSIPFIEDFENESESLNCWTIIDNNNDGFEMWGDWNAIWYHSENEWNAFEGQGAMGFLSFSWDTMSNDDWLISPTIEMSGTYRLKYRYKVGYNGAKLQVSMSTSGANVDDFNVVIVPDTTYLSTNDQYLEKTVILQNIQADTNIGWHIRTHTGSGAEFYIDNVSIEKVDNCIEPLELSVSSLSAQAATISWSNEFDASSWEYVVQQVGGGLPVEQGVFSTVNTVAISQEFSEEVLSANTEYEFYVRTVCEDGTFSIWSGPYLFRTLCEAFTIPFTEGFNLDSDSAICWTILDLNGDGTEYQSQFLPDEWETYEGNQSMKYSNFSENHNDWLISPTLQGSGDYMVRFFYKSNSYPNAFSVLVSENGIDLGSFSEVLSFVSMGITSDWKEKVFYVTDVQEAFNIAFYAGPDQAASFGGSKSFNIDFVRVEDIPDCAEPYEVNVISYTEESMEITWQQYGSATSWEVVALPYGDEFPDDEADLDIHIVTGVPNVILENLESASLYNIYVRAICDESNTSEWSIAVVGGTNSDNDNCIEAILVEVNSGTECGISENGTTLGATLSSDVAMPGSSCMWSAPTKDVWFKFEATSELLDINLNDLFSLFENNPQLYVAIYTGNCGNLEEVFCGQTAWNGNSFFRFSDFQVGNTYYVRVMSNNDTPIFFNFCISTPLPSIKTSESGVRYSVEELVKEVLVKAPCDLISNITYVTGADFIDPWSQEPYSNGIGYFEKNNSIFNFDDGIILATNGVKYSSGPGNGDEGNDNQNWLGDEDLQQILIANGQTSSNYNASVLEFDFIPLQDSIKFDFIFASNEYGPSFQCKYSDVFAFLLTDLETNITTNLAVVPGTDIPVSVTTIRDAAYQGDLTCGDANKEYFDKFYGDSGLDPKDNSINYKGMTIPMSAISAVNPGKTYHIKLAIADYQDSGVNSAVFLRGGSFDLGYVDFGPDMLIEDSSALCETSSYRLDSGLNPNWVEIFWYKDHVVIPGANEPTYLVSEPGEYTVVGKYNAFQGCEVTSSIKIEFYDSLEVIFPKPENIEFCQNTLEEPIDLTVVEEGMFLPDLRREDYDVYYYSSAESRENKVNEIENPQTFTISSGNGVKVYMYFKNKITSCEGDFEFELIPVAPVAPVSPGNQQVCESYTFPVLPKGQFYYTESQANGVEYKAGEVLDVTGEHTIFVYSISGNCYEEVSYNVTVTAAVDGFELEDVVLRCENYILPDLPFGSKYYTDSNQGGIELEPNTEILLSQKIYIYTKSEQGPNHCTSESDFTITYEDCPIPKGISPNGDGLNESLDLGVHGVSSIKIYNRLGTEVYSHGRNYINQWKGQDSKGNELPDGTYYYVIISHGKTKTGWIQINR